MTMRRWTETAIATATAALLAGCATMNAPQDNASDGEPSPSYRLETIATVNDGRVIPPFLSGVTWCGETNFCAVADHEGKMHPFTIAPSDSLAPPAPVFGEPVTLEGVEDAEGVAFDPLRGTVWVSDESGPRISEHDIATGRRLSDIEIPPHLKRCRANLATEALAISTDGLFMWTANEETLECDGPVASKRVGATVRIFRFLRANAESPWIAAGEWAYRTDPMKGETFNGYHRSGIAGLSVDANGVLHALEIEFSRKLVPAFRTRIYTLDFAGAEDVSTVDRLADKSPARVRKTRVYESQQITEMYEDIAFGPEFPDGGRLVVLVADGDDTLAKSVRYLKTRVFTAGVRLRLK